MEAVNCGESLENPKGTTKKCMMTTMKEHLHLVKNTHGRAEEEGMIGEEKRLGMQQVNSLIMLDGPV